jgi:hypothetical protein
MSRSGLEDFTLIFIKKLPASILVKETEDGEPFTLPLSQIEYVDAKKAGYVEVTMPEWLANEKGLI